MSTTRRGKKKPIVIATVSVEESSSLSVAATLLRSAETAMDAVEDALRQLPQVVASGSDCAQRVSQVRARRKAAAQICAQKETQLLTMLLSVASVLPDKRIFVALSAEKHCEVMEISETTIYYYGEYSVENLVSSHSGWLYPVCLALCKKIEEYLQNQQDATQLRYVTDRVLKLMG